MRIAINAQLDHRGYWGGVEQFLIGLVHGLGQLSDGDEAYVIVGHWRDADWLKPHLGANQQLIHAPREMPARASPQSNRFTKLQRWLRRLAGAPAIYIPPSDGYFESLGVDLVHFPYQMLSFCRTPFIYNPHDLQHLHYPDFFSPSEIAARESAMSTACRVARAVATDAHGVKADVIRHYRVPAQRVFAIPMGAPTQLYETVTDQTCAATRRKFDLPSAFALYPAQTWQHKNHLQLIEAIALLRARDHLIVNLLCTGAQNEFYRVIAQRVGELHLEAQVRFLGFIEPTELRALYHLAQFVIHPSLFEGGGLPILEAFNEGAPVACAQITSLPEYAGDAALYFDPASVASIADAAKRMATDAALRASLRERGMARVQAFTWERTARTYRALYRHVAGQKLSAEDCALLKEAQK
ncbi:MAG: glycosyltransferase family 4 protein [Chloroflexi bacterium]|nr:glycosyltransferase family 4 protein [Chloroflexota bacterium]